MPFIRGMEISIRMTEGQSLGLFYGIESVYRFATNLPPWSRREQGANSASDDLVVVNDQYLARHRFS